MHQHVRLGMRLPLRLERLGIDALVDVAFAQPDLDVSVRPVAPHVRAEEKIGKEEDALVFRDRVDHVEHVAAGAGVIELGLHLGGRVDVADGDVARELRLPLAHVARR